MVANAVMVGHLPLLALTAILVLHPLASASCAVSITSTAITVISPSAAIRAKSTMVVLVSMDVKILMNCIKMTGDIIKSRRPTMGFLYSSCHLLVILLRT